uniref:Uncharacterized protein n=1 Tax=Calliactis polypus TaxID=656064 RepID=A0A1D8RAC4_CALPY|nr:hypothetical protein [Calliactis polypus]
MIPISDIDVQQQLGRGPLSGVACSALLTQKNGEKMRVCLRYPRGEQQLESFMNEAIMLSKLGSHPNILKLHGVVVLGQYVDSIALVMEFAPNGNIVESLPLLTVKKFINILPQILKVIQYVDNSGFVHCRLSEFAVFMMSPTVIKIGGFGGCVPRDYLPEKKETNAPHSLPMKFVLNPSIKDKYGMISWFAFFIERIFFLLERSRPNVVPLFSINKPEDNSIKPSTHTKGIIRRKGVIGKLVPNRFSHYCPEVLFPLLKNCGQRNTCPTFEDIFEFLLSKEFPHVVQMNAGFKSEHPGDISVNKDETVLVISKFLVSEHRKSSKNFWFGEREDGRVGLFDGNLSTPISNADVLLDSANELKDQEGTQVPIEIKARGARAELAYRKALQQGKVVVYRGRIMLVGQERAGKTSLKKSLLGLPFNPGEESTVGVEIDPSCCCVEVDNVKNWQRTDHTHIVSDFDDNLARMIADDLKKVEDDREVKQEDESMDITQDEKGTMCQVVQQQLQEESGDDTKDGNVETEEPPTIPEIQEISEDNPTGRSMTPEPDRVPEDVTERVVQILQGLNLEESSTKPQTTISIWDFAGQHLYYASHPVFLSPRAVYLLVYNLSKDLNMEAEPCVRQGAFDILLENADKQTNLEAILSWLVSIHSIRPNDQEESEADLKDSGKCPYIRPPVIVVGTNADQPFEDPKKMEISIKKSLSGKGYQQHLVKPFFTVNNTRSSADEGIQRLQEKIIEVFGMEPYMGEHIPLRWLNFEKVIKALVEKKKTYYLLFADLEKIVHEVCYIEDRDEIRAMLDFYHDLGVIIKHGDTVVLQTQWLIDLFRKLITVRPYDDQNPKFEECWNDLEESGILRMELVEHVFSELLDSGQSKEDLLAMMEHYGLIAAFNQVSDTGETRYFVPAQLTSSPEELQRLQPSPTGPCALYVHFVDGFVPHGLYSFLVSKFIAWCSKDGSPHAPNLFRNVSRFIVGKSSDYELVVICRKRYLKVILRGLQTNKSFLYEPAVAIRRFIESTLQEISEECHWYRSLKYQLSVLCPSCSQSTKACMKHRVVTCGNDDCIHLLAVNDHKIMVCTKSFGKDSRPEVENLEAWYSTPKPEAGSIPTDKLVCLACDIGDKWKAVGRCLGLSDADLDEIEVDEEQLYERCYAVLKRWTEMYGSSANYEVLSAALVHPAVQMGGLAWKYCGTACQETTDASQSGAQPLPEIFLSYQWDIQSTALELASLLKENGFTCWVDIGQMGGGDALYAQIDKGIRSSKVVISCVTNKYCKSENCQREATLADTLKKPIIPLLLEDIPWPPEGQLGPIFAKLLYVDMIHGHQAKIEDLVKNIKPYLAK